LVVGRSRATDDRTAVRGPTVHKVPSGVPVMRREVGPVPCQSPGLELFAVLGCPTWIVTGVVMDDPLLVVAGVALPFLYVLLIFKVYR
jgi:hypothetical protein